jgi:hypothetical protein
MVQLSTASKATIKEGRSLVTSSCPSEADALTAFVRSTVEAAQRIVAPSEWSPGYNADAKAIEEAVTKIAEALQYILALLKTTSSAVQRSAAATATLQAVHNCQNVAQELPDKCVLPANPACAHFWIIKGQQEVAGKSLVCRLAFG